MHNFKGFSPDALPLFLFQHAEEHPADWADLENVFKIIGVKDVSVDYKAAVDEWMALRDKQKHGTTKT